MQKTLTDSMITSLTPPASGRLEIADTRCIGLSLRITASGVKSWSFRFRGRGAGGVARVTLGQYPAVGLSKARTLANEMRATVAAGGDPAGERRLQRGGGRTFAGLAERYLVEHSRRHKRSHAADARNLRKHVLPKWGKRDYTTIRRGDIIELVEGLVTGGMPTLANRVQALVSSIFTFALDAALVDANPCHRLKRRGVENVGDRVLSDAEIYLFWNGIIGAPTMRQIGLGLRLALLTGARVGEVAGLCRAELVDIDDPVCAAWILPAGRVKNGREHLIPLAPLARQTVLDLLAPIPAREKNLLPTRSRRRSGPMTSNSLSQAMAYFSTRIGASDHSDAAKSWGTQPPTPHDLRRTLETRLASLSVSKEIRDRVLNHIPSDVGSRHYDRHDYLQEKRAALMRWEGKLSAILAGGGAAVVALADRRAR